MPGENGFDFWDMSTKIIPWALVENLSSAIPCSTATYLTGFYLGVENARKGFGEV